jgi:hypothetical protein
VGILFIILAVFALGIWCGFLIGFSRAMRQAAVRMQGPGRRATPWVFIAGGSISLVIALAALLHSWWFVNTAARATGIVIEMREQTDKEDGATTYSPTFRFRDASGAEHTVASTASSSPPRHRIGDAVRVLYRPSDPESARIDGYWYLWGFPTITGFVGTFSLAIGLVVLFWPRLLARFKRQRTM